MALHDTTTPDRRPPEELREMSEREAEMWLDAKEFDRWERLQALEEQREHTKAQWREEREETVSTLVKADMGELTTDLDIYGNDVSVLVTLDREQRELMRSIQAKYAGVEDIDELEEAELDTLEAMLADWLEVVIHEFNGQRFDDLSEADRQAYTLEMVREWGLRATMMAMVEVIEAINEQDEQTVEMVEKFRGETG